MANPTENNNNPVGRAPLQEAMDATPPRLDVHEETSTFLQNLPRLTLADISDTDECSVCRNTWKEMVEANVRLVRLPCNHIIDERCLKSTLEHGNKCPYCRSQLAPGRPESTAQLLANFSEFNLGDFEPARELPARDPSSRTWAARFRGAVESLDETLSEMGDVFRDFAQVVTIAPVVRSRRPARGGNHNADGALHARGDIQAYFRGYVEDWMADMYDASPDLREQALAELYRHRYLLLRVRNSDENVAELQRHAIAMSDLVGELARQRVSEWMPDANYFI